MEKNIRPLIISALVIIASSLWLVNYGSSSILENSCKQLWVHAPSTMEEGKEFEFRLAGVFNLFESDGTKRPHAFATRSFTLCSNKCGRESLSKWCAEFIERHFPESEDSHG